MKALVTFGALLACATSAASQTPAASRGPAEATMASAFNLPMAASIHADPAHDSYRILRTAQVGGDGGFDYIFADTGARRLYVPRSGPRGRLTVFDLDSLAPVGRIDGVSAGGAVVDPRSHHGFSTTKPITMWDSNTLKVIRKIAIDGDPDGIMLDPYNGRVWVLSHTPPYATVIDAKEGRLVGTLDLGGAPEQAVSDGKGMIWVNITAKPEIAVVDAKRLTVSAHYDVGAQVSRGSGLALDAANHVLFAYYRAPAPTVVILNAGNGAIITTLPTGGRVDTVAFNPATMEAISAEGAGSMSFIKENSPSSFSVEETLKTMLDAKSLALDTKTGRVFTMTGEFAPAPADAAATPAGSRPARGPMKPGSFTILMVGK